MMSSPMTLLYRYLSTAQARSLTRLLRVRPIHFLTHPVVALVLNIGGMGLLYFTPLFTYSIHNAVLHWLIRLELPP